jgi:alpha-tubulin suppressor-like RCC1 family protein
MKRTVGVAWVSVSIACAGDVASPVPDLASPVASVQVNPDSLVLAQSITETLTALVVDAEGEPRADVPVTWSSSAPSIATVEQDGSVTAVTPGRSVITASAEGHGDSAIVLVQVGWASLSASNWWNHTCGVTVDSAAYCWGANEYGQLGDRTTTDRYLPTPVDIAQTFIAISSGSEFTCALTPAGQGYCWGRNVLGQVGDGTIEDRHRPVPIASAARFESITAGLQHVCALTASELYCWGSNEANQLGREGTGTGDHEPAPTAVLPTFHFSSVTTGVNHTCGVASDGAYCWGWNEYGQLGDGTRSFGGWTPVKVAVEATWKSLGAAYLHTCGVERTGALYCWGTYAGSGSSIEPRRLGTTDLHDVGRGRGHLCGIGMTNDRAYCWGHNHVGQIGDNSTTQRDTPTLVQTAVRFSQIATGSAHTCGVGTDRHAYCWGANHQGQLGLGAPRDRELVPTRVAEPVTTPLLAGWATTGRQP